MPAVNDIKAFIPARDYSASLAFYQAIGFSTNWSSEAVSEMQIGDSRFLLQNYYVREFAENCMLSLHVPDLESWWQFLLSLNLTESCPGCAMEVPVLQPWGLKVLYLRDPSGVLWHITEDKPD